MHVQNELVKVYLGLLCVLPLKFSPLRCVSSRDTPNFKMGGGQYFSLPQVEYLTYSMAAATVTHGPYQLERL
jgi:CRISPR/Cas system endoribonuclease Cas6 (RAMP superfamily)